MSRLNKTEDIIKLAMMFQNSFTGLCIDDIKEAFECSRRSAERMKTVLFDLFPDKIEEIQNFNSTDKKKRWRFTKGTMNSLITFTSDDFANLESLKGLSNDENQIKQLDEIIAKIKALTPQKNMMALDTDVSAILESQGYAIRQYARENVDNKVLEQIRNSMLAFKKVSFDYYFDDTTKRITLNPYGIVIGDRYYLVGFNEYVKDLRMYRVSKILNLEILEDYFNKDEKFSLSEYCKNSFGIYQEEPLNITLEFDKSVAEDVLNYHFHPTQKFKTLENGNISVKFTSGGMFSIAHELFKWGKDVKIITPKKLKTYYKNYVKEVLENI